MFGLGKNQVQERPQESTPSICIHPEENPGQKALALGRGHAPHYPRAEGRGNAASSTGEVSERKATSTWRNH